MRARRSAKDRGEHRQAAGAIAQALISGVCQQWRHAGTHVQVSGEPVEEQWKTCRRSPKKAWRDIYLVAAPKNAERVGL